MRIKDEPIGAISFGADRPAVYEDDDVELARRIADHIALALAHERLAEEAGRAARAQERASMLEERVSSLVQELKPRCASCPWRVRAVEACARRCNESRGNRHHGIDHRGVRDWEGSHRALHPPRIAQRARGPFIGLNCAALPEQLLECELLATSAAHSQERTSLGQERSSRPPAACSFSTRSAR